MTDRRLPHAAGALALALAALLSGCASDPPTPAEQRRIDVEHRLEQTFSPAQSRCILKQLSPAALTALDRSGTVPAGDALVNYSNAVTACVLGLGG